MRQRRTLGNTLLTVGWTIVSFAFFVLALCIVSAIIGCGGMLPEPKPAQVEAVVTEVERIACVERGLQIIHTSDTCQLAVDGLARLVATFPACKHVFGEHAIQLVCDAPKKEGFYDEVRTRPPGHEGSTRGRWVGLPCNSDLSFRQRTLGGWHGGSGPTWLGDA